MNDNGQRLLELCSYQKLCVTNTFFQNKTCHKASWKHPRSNQWHQLDLIITKHCSLNDVHNTRVFHSADCDTDHALVISKIKIRPKRLHYSKKNGQPKIDTRKTADPTSREEFVECLLKSLPQEKDQNAEKCWESLRTTIYETAMKVFGRKKHNSADWFDANITELTPLIDAKRHALIAIRKTQPPKTTQP